MDDLEMVFLGTHTFTFTLPTAAEVEKENYETVEVPGFEAVCTFRRLNELQAAGEPAFTHVQAVCVTEIEDLDFRGGDFSSVLVSHEAVRWVFCFPVTQVQGVHYALETSIIPSGDDDVFLFFDGTTPAGAPIQAVPDLDSLKFLSPRPGSRLGLVRAKDWHWDKERIVVYIRPRDILEVETILDSEVRLF